MTTIDTARTANRKYLIALTAVLGLFPVVLDSTIVNIAIVPIARALHTDVNSVQWIALGYLLSNAAVISFSGYLGNRVGVKRLFIIGIAVFGLCSFLCGVAPNEGWLIGLRILQGLGGGMLIPLGMAIALEPFATVERAKANAIVGVPLLLGPVVGPIIGGLMIDNLGWQSIFFINVPVCVIAIALAWRILPTDQMSKPAQRTRFDYLGLALSTVGVSAVIYGVKLVTTTDPATMTTLNPQGTIYGWGYWMVWMLVGVGGALLAAFIVYAWRSRGEAVLDLRQFQRYDFAVGNLVLWIGGIVTFGVMFLVPVFLQQVRLPNLSALDTGVALVPMGIGTLVGIVLGGGLYRKVGARPLAVVGAGLFAFSFWQLDSLTATTSTGSLSPRLFLLGLSVTLTMVPAQTLALEALSGATLTSATSLVNVAKLLFGSVGSAAMVTIFIQRTTYHGDQLKAQLAGRLPTGTVSHPTASQLAAARQQLAAQAGTSGLNDVFAILVYGALVLLVVALLLPGRRSPQRLEEHRGEEAGGVSHDSRVIPGGSPTV